MRHFVECPSCGHKVYFRSNAGTRWELPAWFSLACQNTACPSSGLPLSFSAQDAKAEKSSSATAGGLAVGGLLGALIGGPFGLLAGLLVGGGTGHAADSSSGDAERFNAS